MPRHRGPGEGVADDQVIRVGRLVAQAQAAIAKDHRQDSEVHQTEFLAGDLEHHRIELQDAPERVRPRGLDVARQGEPTTTDVQPAMGSPAGARPSTTSPSKRV